MTLNETLTLFTGITVLLFSVWLFSYVVKETKRGYRSRFGNDIKLYFGAIMGIVLGVVLILKTLF